ncbi:MAG TPA: IS1595 family transposase, partial [Ktedonobacteraceae bacterium]|nr:IS1595 family transposase [Ktedonobacteraceae bacterium]
MRYTFSQFREEYPDDDACLLAVLNDRFGSTCPKCGVIDTKFYRIKGRKAFSCGQCHGHVYPLANTIFHKSDTSLWNWFYAIYQFSVAKNGVSAKEIERSLGVTYKTAWRMCKQIRLLMAQENGMLSGDVEVDETYIGGKHRRKYGTSKKQVVFGAVERGGMASIKHVKSSGARVLLPELESSIAPASHVYSDEYGVYKTLERRGYTHTTVNHSRL